MKKIINIVLTLIVILPYLIAPYEVKSQTFGELKKELQKFEQDYINNQNKQKLTNEEISKTKEDILNTSIET